MNVKPGYVRKTVLLRVTLHTALKAEAAKQGRGISDLLNDYVERCLPKQAVAYVKRTKRQS